MLDTDLDGIVSRLEFVNNISQIYMGTMDEKLKFTFQIYDLDRDNRITPDDIRYVLSHVPFVRSIENETPNSLLIRKKHFFQEGKYNKEDGKITLYKDRINDQQQIDMFILKVFQKDPAQANDQS